MGMVRSQTNLTGTVIGGVTLGVPVLVRVDGSPAQPGDSMLTLYLGWDDSALPSGTADSQGTVTPD